MRVEWVAVLAVILSAGASAQQIAQRPVRTEKITGAPTGVGLYEIGPDGTVLINWRAVETAASGPADRMSASVAKMMLAIRGQQMEVDVSLTPSSSTASPLFCAALPQSLR